MSQQRLRELLQTQLDDLQGQGALQARTPAARPARARPSASAAATSSTSAPTTTSASPIIPTSSPPRTDGLKQLRLRHGVGPLHLRHPGHAQAARSSHRPLPRQGRRDPLQLLLGRQRRPVRDDPRRGRRHPQRRAEPRQHHRRRPPVQGEALPLQELRHGRPRTRLEGSEGQPAAADRDRRRLLDGRRPGAAAGHLRPGRPATTPSSWSTTATPPASSAPAAAARRSSSACLDRIDIITSTLGKTLGGAAGGFTCAAAESRRLSCGSARGRTSSPTPLPPPIVMAAHEGAGADRQQQRPARPAARQRAAACAPAWKRRASRSSRASIRSCR